MLQRLNKGGLIKSVRGPGGGYKLNCVPSETPLYPIFELLGGPFESHECSFEGCRGKKCFIADMVGRDVSIEISVITPSLGQKHPNFGHIAK